MINWKTEKNDKEKYKAYLASREWSVKKEAVRRRSGGYCERCLVNEQHATHHLTYARKYNEELTDLQAICNECHDFTHGKIDKDQRRLGWSVYFAGKISEDCWRVRSDCADPGTFQKGRNSDIWSAVRNAIAIQDTDKPTYLFDYSGPFFMLDACHGSGDVFGETTHGRGDQHGHAVYEHGACVGVDYDRSKWQHDTFNKCFKAISESQVVLAWIDSEDCYGTLVELGMAKALGKAIFIGFPYSFVPNELWFAKLTGSSSYWDGPSSFVTFSLTTLVSHVHKARVKAKQ